MKCVTLFNAGVDQRVAIYADRGLTVKHYRAVIRMLELELSWAEEDEAAQGTSAFRQDAERLEAQPAGPVAKPCAQPLSSPPEEPFK